MKTRLLDSDTFSYLLRQREPVASRATDYILRFRRAGTPIGDADLLIAAIALANHCVLVTNNIKHFAHVPGLELENWADPSTS